MIMKRYGEEDDGGVYDDDDEQEKYRYGGWGKREPVKCILEHPHEGRHKYPPKPRQCAKCHKTMGDDEKHVFIYRVEKQEIGRKLFGEKYMPIYKEIKTYDHCVSQKVFFRGKNVKPVQIKFDVPKYTDTKLDMFVK